MLTLEGLAKHLATAVGDARATSTIQEAAKVLGIPGPLVDKATAIRLLESIAKRSDVTGIAARLLKVRVEFAYDSLAATP